MKTKILSILAAGVLAAAVPGGSARAEFMPYMQMAKAAKSPLSVMAQQKDKRLELRLKAALLAEGPGTLPLKVHVYMDEAYLVGYVKSEEEKERIVEKASSFDEIKAVHQYLVVKDQDSTWTDANDLEAGDGPAASAMPGSPLKGLEMLASVKKTLRAAGVDAMIVDMKLMNRTVVLSGVLPSRDDVEKAVAAVEAMPDVEKVVNFLEPVRPEYAAHRPRPRLLRRGAE